MSPASLPPLAANAVHVWRIPLDPADSVVARMGAVLSRDELKRAEHFQTSTLRRRFVAGRGGLRMILGRYLGVGPERLEFAVGERGKPRLLGDCGGLEFNLAHTEDLALCAITQGRAIGIDIERVRPMPDAEQIVSRFFGEREQAEFFNYPPQERLAAFFRAWTRKESYVKATGEGLARHLSSFAVTLAAASPAILTIGNDPDAARRWTLRDIDLGPEYSAALTVAGEPGSVLLSDWEWGQ